jgi:hypothetical protein
MQKTRADFAKDLYKGPGWNGAGTKSIGAIGVDGLKKVSTLNLDGNRCATIESTHAITRRRLFLTFIMG